MFPSLLEEQDFLATPEQWDKMLALAPAKVRDRLKEEWAEHTEMSSLDRWKRLTTELKVWGPLSGKVNLEK